MMRKIYIPPKGPPKVRPNPQIYAEMGEENIFKMMEDFYLEIEKSSIRDMFPDDMKRASIKSAKFFVTLLGGPPLYQQEYGPPMMRKRHFPFTIDEKARLVWLQCFDTILKEADMKYNFPKEHLEDFIRFIDHFSSWMVNS